MLTQLAISNAKPKAKPYKLSDGGNRPRPEAEGRKASRRGCHQEHVRRDRYRVS
jgi:hypothetical protein